jgi:hypothetical protein
MGSVDWSISSPFTAFVKVEATRNPRLMHWAITEDDRTQCRARDGAERFKSCESARLNVQFLG